VSGTGAKFNDGLLAFLRHPADNKPKASTAIRQITASLAFARKALLERLFKFMILPKPNR
jgi:hypothetical protein